MSKQKGFTLVEALIVTTMMLVTMGVIYSMILYFRDVTGTEQARVRQVQESRFLLSSFSNSMKNAGAVLTMTHSGSFLGAETYFNGIFPLNNNAFPDGVILASGDPGAATRLMSAVVPRDDATLQVENITATPAWAAGDLGIIISSDGYYVFRVASVGTNIVMDASSAVYYSGLLSTTNYDDPSATAGNAIEYPVNAPVVRLDDFGIFLVREFYDFDAGRMRRQLLRVSDCRGDADVLATSSPAEKSLIADNIWDMQFVYSSYPNFPDVSGKIDYFKKGSAAVLIDLLADMRSRTFKEVALTVVALTDDYPGKGSAEYTIPIIGDEDSYVIPPGKFNYRIHSLLIQPMNFGISI